MKNRALFVIGLFALMTAAVFAQTPQVRAQIDFSFTVENKTLPAGTYDFIRDDTASVFRVTDNGKNEAMAPIMTRLASFITGGGGGSYVVFDKVGDKFVLAEIWTAGEDGYAVSVTKAKHEHRIVKAK